MLVTNIAPGSVVTLSQRNKVKNDTAEYPDGYLTTHEHTLHTNTIYTTHSHTQRKFNLARLNEVC